MKTSARTSLTNQASVSSDVEDADPADNQVSLTTAVIPFLPIYDEDFEDIPGSEWCTTGRSTTPSGRTFLGEFGNEHTCLSLDNLPKHTQVIVEVELYAIRSWDGSQVEWGTQMLQRYGPPSPSDPNYIVGPDRWIMQADGKTLLDTTFANWGEFPQAYPGPYPASTYPARTGAAENNTLGYTYGPADMDSVYHLKFTIPHTASTLELDFAAIGLLPDLLDESWGIDNVAVAISFGGGQTIVYLPAISR